MAGGEECIPVLYTVSGSGTGETLAVTSRGTYSVGPFPVSGYRKASWCECSERRDKFSPSTVKP